jgi:hypothetical protein
VSGAAGDGPKEAWYSKIGAKALIVAVILAAVGAIGSGIGKDVYSRIRGQNRARLELLDARILGEPGANPNYNEVAGARIFVAHDFPYVELLVKNVGDKTATLRDLNLDLRSVSVLQDPYGIVVRSADSPRPNSPPFGVHGPNDVRVSSNGFTVPDRIALQTDVKPAESATVTVTLRNVEEPSSKEYVADLDLKLTYNDAQSLQVNRVFVAFLAIGTPLPQYEYPAPSYTPQTSRFDPAVAAKNREVLANIPTSEVHLGPRVKYLRNLVTTPSTAR